MDRINFDFFDFFGSVVPGIPFLISLGFLITGSSFSFSDIMEGTNDISAALIMIYLIIAYCIGFSFHYPAYELFKILICKWWPKRTDGFEISFGKREKELTAIRSKSPQNFKLISKFMALRQMAYSLFFSTITSTVLLLITSIIYGFNSDFWAILIISIFFGFLFLRRAVDFHQRSHQMITAAYTPLERA